MGESQESILKIKSKVKNVSKSRFVQHSPIERARSPRSLSGSWYLQDKTLTRYLEEARSSKDSLNSNEAKVIKATLFKFLMRG